MMNATPWFFAASLTMLWMSVLLFIRNIQVAKYRTALLDRISAQAQHDIHHEPSRPWRWRYDEFEQVSYERMLYQFWRPLNRFYSRDPARETGTEQI